LPEAIRAVIKSGNSGIDLSLVFADASLTQLIDLIITTITGEIVPGVYFFGWKNR
jgi:hypothetical protein